MATDGRGDGDAGAETARRPERRAAVTAEPRPATAADDWPDDDSATLKSWGQLTALDVTALRPRRDPAEEGLRTGGLLGVDSGLLNLLDDDHALSEADLPTQRPEDGPAEAAPQATPVEATATPAAPSAPSPLLADDDPLPPLVDTWTADEPSPEPMSRGASATLAPLAPPARVHELDPFAAPVGAGLPDELDGIDDPFDSVAPLNGPGLGEAWRSGTRPTRSMAPVAAPPPAAPEGDEAPWLAPTPEEVAAARALLAERSHARRARLAEAAVDAELLVVEEILHDGEDRRVVRVEFPSLDDLDVEEIAETPPDEAPVDALSEEASDGIHVFAAESPPPIPASPLDRLSREPVDLREERPSPPPLPVAPPPASPARVEASEPAPVEALRPSWEGSAREEPPSLDAEALERRGVPFLGAIPAFAPVRNVRTFPVGSPVALEPSSAGGPPVVPDLVVPASAGPQVRALIERLAAEIDAESDRGRLALLLHGFGRLAADLPDGAGAALTAFLAADGNDSGFQLNRWALDDALLDAGRTDELMARLNRTGGAPRAESDGLLRAAHLAATRLGDGAGALAHLERAAALDPDALAPLLARVLLLLSQLDWDGALPAVEAAIAAGEGATLTGTLMLEAVRLREELGATPAELHALHEDALERVGGAPALLASLEHHVAAHGGLELLLAGLRARADAVGDQLRDGRVPEDEARREMGEVLFKAAWALERLGRRTEALREYQSALQALPSDPYVLYRTAELARRLGRADEQRAALERVASLARDPAEAANALYQMGLIAQKVLADETLATADFERAVAALPTFTPALAALGRQSIRQGRWHDVLRRFTGEIAQLEEALASDAAPEVRARTIRGLLARYFRAARVLEERLDEPEAATAYHKRALALAPDFLPSFFELERLYQAAGRWRELVALDLGLVDRLEGGPLDTVPFLLRAADLLRGRLRDDRNAGRVYARALARRPDDQGALEGASDVFARLGHRAAQVEVDARWARTLTAPEDDRLATSLLVRAAELQELDGDPLAAAAEAAPLFREALARRPGDPAAFDGLLRTSARLGRVSELSRQARDPATADALPALSVLLAAEALVAAEQFAAAADVLRQWRDRLATERSALPVAAEEAADRAALTLLALAYERAEAWRPLADTLEEVAGRTRESPTRAALLVRIGELWEHRLDQPELAEDAFQRALAADPGATGAREGRDRLAARRGVPAEPLVVDLPAAVVGTDLADDPRTAFEARPDRRDRFEAWMARLTGPGHEAERLQALQTRLPHAADDDDRLELLAAILGQTEALGDAAATRAAAEALIEADPTSVAAALALRRLADTDDARLAAGERLASLLQAPSRAAGTWRALADEAERAGAGPERVRALLEQAVALDPADEAAGAALEARLRASGDWPDLLELFDRRIVAAGAPEVLRRLQLGKASLLAGPLADAAAALACCEAVLELMPDDAEAALLAADLAQSLGETRRALAVLEGAAGTADPAAAAEIAIRRADLLFAAGDGAAARSLLEPVAARDPDRRDVLERLAELRAVERDWTGVVAALRRLLQSDPDDDARAERAIAIGEILSRAHGEHRLAAGWFKRAVELAPARTPAVWRLLEEAERAPDGSVSAEHLADAVDRAILATRSRIDENPFEIETLQELARLVRARGDADAWYVACGALVYLNAAGPAETAYFRDRSGRVAVDFAAPLDAERRRRLLWDEGEVGLAPALFAPFALVLTELLAERMPPGATRLSGRSYARWQSDFRQLAAGLDMGEVEAWQIGPKNGHLRGRYLPRPAIEASTELLEQAVDARQAFRLGRLLEQLRDGRLLLVQRTERIARAVAVMGGEVAPEIVGDVREGTGDALLDARLVDRARRLPRRVRLMLETLPPGALAAADFAAYAAAISASSDRAGLLACGDLGAALDELAGRATDASTRVERLRAAPAAGRLLAFALGPAYLELRRALGLAVSR